MNYLGFTSSVLLFLFSVVGEPHTDVSEYNTKHKTRKLLRADLLRTERKPDRDMRSYLPPEQTRWFLKVKAKGIRDLQRIRRDIKLKTGVLFAFPYLRDNSKSKFSFT